MDAQTEFLTLYSEFITRDGSQQLLEYLQSAACDFFTAPASTRYHGSCDGGLVAHSVNVFHCLSDYLDRPKVQDEYGICPRGYHGTSVQFLEQLAR